MSVSDMMGRIRRQLSEQGVSQAAFARQIEVSPQTLSAWMSGRNRPGVLDVQASCGNGSVVSGVCLCDLIRVNRPWIARHCGVVNQRALNLITIFGDSMMPTLRDGDIVVVDTSAKVISTDAMYAFNLDDDLFVKRIQRVGRGLRVISDNAIYPAYTLSADELDHGFIVHGRVVTTCQINRI